MFFGATINWWTRGDTGTTPGAGVSGYAAWQSVIQSNTWRLWPLVLSLFR